GGRQCRDHGRARRERRLAGAPLPRPGPHRRAPGRIPRTSALKPRVSMIAFVFPGQGAQKVGMGRSLAEAFPICRDTFAEADAALGEALSELCFEVFFDGLAITENT